MSKFVPAIEFVDKNGKKQIEFCASFDEQRKRVSILQCIEHATNVQAISLPVHDFHSA